MKFLEYYKNNHKTRGCQVCHTMAMVQFIWAIFSPYRVLFIMVGLVLLLIGHLVFEKNLPAFVSIFKRKK